MKTLILILTMTVCFGQDSWLTDSEVCEEPLLENPFNILYNQNETIIIIRDNYFGTYYQPTIHIIIKQQGDNYEIPNNLTNFGINSTIRARHINSRFSGESGCVSRFAR